MTQLGARRRRGPRASATGSRPGEQPDDEDPPSAGRELVGERSRAAAWRPRGCGRRRHDERVRRRTTSNRPGTVTPAEGLGGRRRRSSGRPKNASTAATAQRGVVALVARRAAARRRRRARPSGCAGRAAGHRPPAGRRRRSNSSAAAPERRGGALGPGRSRRARGRCSPSTSRASGLTMPAFSAAMRRRQSPRAVGVVPADVGDDGDVGVDHVGGVAAAEQADLDDGDVDGELGEPDEAPRR